MIHHPAESWMLSALAAIYLSNTMNIGDIFSMIKAKHLSLDNQYGADMSTGFHKAHRSFIALLRNKFRYKNIEKTF
jgi:hypothetical protein